jgi:hypothetical protein
MVIRAHTIQFQQDGQDSKYQADSLRDQTLVLMTRMFSRRRIVHLLAKNLNTFQMSLQFTAINHSTIQFQEVGPESKYQEDSLRDQIQALMMKMSFRRRVKVKYQRTNGLEHHLSTYQMLHLSMVINHFTILCQVAGQESKFQADSLRDQTQALMMKMSFKRRVKVKYQRTNGLEHHLNMCQMLHQSMVISLFTTRYQVDGQESKFQADSSRDQTLVSMMKMSFRRKNQQFKTFNKLIMFQSKLQSMEISLFTTQYQVDGLANRSQVDNLKDQILGLMMKLS